MEVGICLLVLDFEEVETKRGEERFGLVLGCWPGGREEGRRTRRMSGDELRALEAKKKALQEEYEALRNRGAAGAPAGQVKVVGDGGGERRVQWREGGHVVAGDEAAARGGVVQKGVDGAVQFFLNERDHEQLTRGFGDVFHPNLKHMYDGVNPDVAVEKHMKAEMRKREYAMELERQIAERKRREIMDRQMARAASRERIYHALHAPTALIPSPGYVGAKPRRAANGPGVDRADAAAPAVHGERGPRGGGVPRNARELFPGEPRVESNNDVRALRGQLEQMQRRLNEIQSAGAVADNNNNNNNAIAYNMRHNGAADIDGRGREEQLRQPQPPPPPQQLRQHQQQQQQFQSPRNNNLAERSRHYEEDYSVGAPRVRLKFEEPDERLRIEAEEAKKMQYARELQAQIAEKAARDRARKKEQDEYDLKHEREAMQHNPFGKVGGGAPLKNAQGEVEPSLHMLRSPENVKGSNAYVNRGGGGGVGDGNGDSDAQAEVMPALKFRQDNPFQSKEERDAKNKLETDYQRALREQIEEKNRLKAIEAEKERQEIEREDRRLAEEQKRMKEQYEREQSRERMKREKALHENTVAAAAKEASKKAQKEEESVSPAAVPRRALATPANEATANDDADTSSIRGVHQQEQQQRANHHRQVSNASPYVSQQPPPRRQAHVEEHLQSEHQSHLSRSPEPRTRRDGARHTPHGRQSRSEMLSSLSRLELEKLRQEFQVQQDAFEERIKDVVSEKESEMIDLRERAQLAEEDREAARAELEMIKAEIRFRQNMEEGFEGVGMPDAREEQDHDDDPAYARLLQANDEFAMLGFHKNGPGPKAYPHASKPSTAATSIDLGASLAGDSQFIFPVDGSRPVRTPGAVSEANTNVSASARSDLIDLPDLEEKRMVSEVEDVAARNSRRLFLLNELEHRRSNGENLDVLLGEFIERTREDDGGRGAPDVGGLDDDLMQSNLNHDDDLGKTLDAETRWIA